MFYIPTDFIDRHVHSCIEYVIAEPTGYGKEQSIIENALPFTKKVIDNDASCGYGGCRYKYKDIPVCKRHSYRH